MDIIFKTKKFQKDCSDQKKLIRVYGQRQAKLIRRRLDELRAAATLDEVRRIPGPRCHELRGNRSGQFSVDLDHPYRLILRPTDDPLPKNPDGGLNWKGITAIEILAIEDTHE
jgi:proteic killer suppression protein